MENKQTKKMKSNKSLKDYRTSLTPQYNGAIIKQMIQVRVTNMKTKYVPISVTTITFPTTTTTRTATKHMLADRHTVTISLSPLPHFEYRRQRGIRPAACELC